MNVMHTVARYACLFVAAILTGCAVRLHHDEKTLGGYAIGQRLLLKEDAVLVDDDGGPAPKRLSLLRINQSRPCGATESYESSSEAVLRNCPNHDRCNKNDLGFISIVPAGALLTVEKLQRWSATMWLFGFINAKDSIVVASIDHPGNKHRRLVDIVDLSLELESEDPGGYAQYAPNPALLAPVNFSIEAKTKSLATHCGAH